MLHMQIGPRYILGVSKATWTTHSVWAFQDTSSLFSFHMKAIIINAYTFNTYLVIHQSNDKRSSSVYLSISFSFVTIDR